MKTPFCSFWILSVLLLFGFSLALELAVRDFAPGLNEDDFLFALAASKPIADENGGTIQTAFSGAFPGLVGQGQAAVLATLNRCGLILPHTHPRATEIDFITQGNFLICFVDTKGKTFCQIVKQGDVFIIPESLLHFQLNIGDGVAQFVGGFNNENPGVEANNFIFAVDDALIAATLNVKEADVRRIRGYLPAAPALVQECLEPGGVQRILNRVFSAKPPSGPNYASYR
eukprot:TRINITY_DN14983_c0_g1::TRINITY_DN14983_c0_g1_i1::g.25853::m.25853 TRINITY_DN14983_c0_g1::TRINITY_DN14983_c0_g1_i1::g.25853  ORF type:complete len:229 (-),score=23.02,sp/P09351/SR1B_PHYPO/34.64/8e-24,Cupin_1/PF00190.17/5.2e-19,Cupin_2/PF07883.6/4.8e-05 TRINITY_DN14983_c0_g1_i1:65-751(-)